MFHHVIVVVIVIVIDLLKQLRATHLLIPFSQLLRLYQYTALLVCVDADVRFKLDSQCSVPHLFFVIRPLWTVDTCPDVTALRDGVLYVVSWTDGQSVGHNLSETARPTY